LGIGSWSFGTGAAEPKIEPLMGSRNPFWGILAAEKHGPLLQRVLVLLLSGRWNLGLSNIPAAKEF